MIVVVIASEWGTSQPCELLFLGSTKQIRAVTAPRTSRASTRWFYVSVVPACSPQTLTALESTAHNSRTVNRRFDVLRESPRANIFTRRVRSARDPRTRTGSSRRSAGSQRSKPLRTATRMRGVIRSVRARACRPSRAAARAARAAAASARARRAPRASAAATSDLRAARARRRAPRFALRVRARALLAELPRAGTGRGVSPRARRVARARLPALRAARATKERSRGRVIVSASPARHVRTGGLKPSVARRAAVSSHEARRARATRSLARRACAARRACTPSEASRDHVRLRGADALMPV